ncbi:MAG TPA: ATP synthase F1 subunit delta [Chitinophagaceae bacterium]|nr:ATP synthase F1 subunit delta [Chitinophagaceae bacterium]
MSNPRLAARYAKSLIDLAIEKEQLEKVFADIQWLQSVCKVSREFVNVLRSPIIKADKKIKIIDAITTGKMNELTAAFTRLLIHKAREKNLPEIITAFIDQYKKFKHIYSIKLTTAAPVSEELKNAIVKQIQSVSEMQNIELETAVNPELIGGFVLQAGDQLVDASIAYDLKNIAKQFDNNDFIYKIR